MKQYDYHVIEFFCEECQIITYGLSVYRIGDSQLEPCISIKDISSNRAAVAQLAAQCQRLQLDPIHLLDMIPRAQKELSQDKIL